MRTPVNESFREFLFGELIFNDERRLVKALAE